MKCKFLRACLNKWRKMGSRVIPWAAYEYCYQRPFWPSMDKGNSIPRDVPKGHLVVYVGENCKRFVIKVNLLKHPLFKALLDQAQDEYDFTTESKLCIPCDENIFLDVVHCAGSPQHQRLSQIQTKAGNISRSGRPAGNQKFEPVAAWNRYLRIAVTVNLFTLAKLRREAKHKMMQNRKATSVYNSGPSTEKEDEGLTCPHTADSAIFNNRG